MLLSTTILIAACLIWETNGGTTDKVAQTSVNDRTVFIRSLPGLRGVRSNLYEVYMEPYLFVCINWILCLIVKLKLLIRIRNI